MVNLQIADRRWFVIVRSPFARRLAHSR